VNTFPRSRRWGWEELRCRPHLAEFGGEQIVIVVRDRELSTALEAELQLRFGRRLATAPRR